MFNSIVFAICVLFTFIINPLLYAGLALIPVLLFGLLLFVSRHH